MSAGRISAHIFVLKEKEIFYLIIPSQIQMADFKVI